MLRKLVAGALIAGSALVVLPSPAVAVVDCEYQTPCFCGTQIVVGVPGKDPLFSASFDC